MSKDPNLLDRLERLSAAGLSGPEGRVLIAADPDRLTALALRELDTVILPRLVIFRTPDGGGLLAEVGNRRVLRIAAGDGSGLSAPLDHADPTLADTVRAAFREGFGESGEVSVSKRPMTRDYDPTEIGISVAALFEAWDLPAAPKSQPEAAVVIDEVLFRTQSHVGAWVVLAGEHSESSGEPDLVDALTALGSADIAPGLGYSGLDLYPNDPWHLMALRQGSITCVIATISDTRLLMSVTPSAVGKIASVWRDVVAG